MKIFLHLLKERRSAVGYQLSVVGYQPEWSNRSPTLKRCLPIKYPLSPTTYKRISFLLFILVFVSCSAALAQEQGVHTAPAAKAETEITPLKIGDRIPDELWEMHFPVVSAKSDQVQYLSLSDFRDKLIILDFWATWCAPCIKSLSTLDSIQSELTDNFVVIPVTNEDPQKVKKYFKSRSWNLPTVVNDTDLQKYFPHKYIPHYIWINRKGEVAAITGHEPVDRQNIRAMIMQEVIKMPFKNDLLTFDPKVPLFIDGNGGDGSSIKYRSLFSEYIPGLSQTASSVTTDTNKKTSRVYCINCQILMLYTVAYSKVETFPENRVILDVKDPSRLRASGNENDLEEWLKNNTYSYELITPTNPQNRVREQMAEDLNRFFGLRAYFENRLVDCYVLTALPGLEKSYSKGGNREDNLSDEHNTDKYIHNNTMDALYGYLNEVLPLNVVDETNCLNTLDLQFPQPDEGNFPMLQEALRKQGISLEKDKREIEFFIISDHNAI